MIIFNKFLRKKYPMYLSKLVKINQNFIEKEKKFVRAVQGSVQGGKTNFIIEASNFFLNREDPISSIIVLRNSIDDRKQLSKRINHESFHSVNSTTLFNEPGIYAVLGNRKNISYVNPIRLKFVLFIDEVDLVNDPECGYKHELLKYISNSPLCVGIFGISATILDFLYLKKLKGSKYIIKIEKNKYYCGPHSVVRSKNFVETANTTPKYIGENVDILENDPLILDFHGHIMNQSLPTYTTEEKIPHPHICLISICRIMSPLKNLQKCVSQMYPEAVILLYNADGVTFYKGTREIIYHSDTISDTLSRIKERNVKFWKKHNRIKYTHIFIYAGDKASRGISFVDNEYEYHLTSMRLLVSDECSEPNLIQKIRLYGIYKKYRMECLTLYTTSKIWSDISKALIRQREFIHMMNKTSKSIQKVPYSRLKLTGRKVFHSPQLRNEDLNLIDEQDDGYDYMSYIDDKIDTKNIWSLDIIELRTGKISQYQYAKQFTNVFDHMNPGDDKFFSKLRSVMYEVMEKKTQGNVNGSIDRVMSNAGKLVTVEDINIEKFVMYKIKIKNGYRWRIRKN